MDKANNTWRRSETILGKGRGYAAAVGGVDVNDRWWVMGGDDDNEASKVRFSLMVHLLRGLPYMMSAVAEGGGSTKSRIRGEIS